MDDGRCGFGVGVTGGFALESLFAARGALAAGDGVLTAGTFAL